MLDCMMLLPVLTFQLIINIFYINQQKCIVYILYISKQVCRFIEKYPPPKSKQGNAEQYLIACSLAIDELRWHTIQCMLLVMIFFLWFKISQTKSIHKPNGQVRCHEPFNLFDIVFMFELYKKNYCKLQIIQVVTAALKQFQQYIIALQLVATSLEWWC